jgi:hypothetical protein
MLHSLGNTNPGLVIAVAALACCVFVSERIWTHEANKTTIHGPTNDGTYIAEFKKANGVAGSHCDVAEAAIADIPGRSSRHENINGGSSFQHGRRSRDLCF